MSSFDLTAVAGRSGSLDVLTPASPAAGANYSFTVGSKNVVGLRIVACKATLTTDANVASRLFSLDYIGDRSGTMIRNAPHLLVTASTGATVYQWDRAHTTAIWNTGTPVFVPLVDVLLSPGWTVQLTVDSKQAGDTITAITFVVENYYGDS